MVRFVRTDHGLVNLGAVEYVRTRGNKVAFATSNTRSHVKTFKNEEEVEKYLSWLLTIKK